jgi:glyoxylase-like metal-dependent hydrolase (beta-lactamase superfamily II)
MGNDSPMSTYTGDVTPGGAAQTRELSTVMITKVAVDEKMSNNAYLLSCRATGAQVLVDAAAEPETLLSLIDVEQLRAVVTTHQHWDHHRALADVVAVSGAVVLVGAPDADAVTEQTGVPVTRTLEHGDTVAFGDLTLEVIAVRGHTPGSICLLLRDPEDGVHLFTGDSLFPGGVGNTQGDAERFAQLLNDVEQRIFDVLPGSTWFYPGHGNDGVLSEEVPQLPEWRERGW